MNPFEHSRLIELILNSLGEGVIVANKEGRIVLLNPMGAKIVGHEAEDTPYVEWPEIYGIFCPDGVTRFPVDEIPLVRAVRGESTDEVELIMRNPRIPDGVFLRCTGRPLHDESGELVGGVVVFRDISRELRSIHEFKQAAADVLVDLAKRYDSDLPSALKRIAEADARLLKVDRVSVWLFDESRESVVCETLFSLSRDATESGSVLQARSYPRYFAALEESRVIDAGDALKDPRTGEFAENYLKPLGIASMLDVPIRLHGRVAGVVCHEHVGKPRRWSPEEKEFATSIADLVSLAFEASERRKVDEELREACDELQKLNQLKTNFVSMISHELKTPLAAIQESVGVIRDGLDGPVNPAQMKTLEIARLNAEWLGRLINNFLTFSRIEAGRMDMRFQRLDARALVEEACRLLKPAADKKGITLIKSIPAEPMDVLWDSDRMKALALNLIENAIKYTDAPGQVRVRLSSSGEDAVLEVEDTGVGIRDQDKATIFDLFAQSARQGPWRTGGFGIGLTICRYVAEHHGGALTVESEHGKGSCFKARIPIKPPTNGSVTEGTR